MTGIRKKILFALFSVCFGLGVGLLSGELLLRHFAPPWLVQRMNDLNLTTQAEEFGSDAGWSVERSGGRFVRFTPFTHFDMKYYEYQNKVDIDRWGGRVVNGNRDKEGDVQVPFLGDSFMFGVGVEDNQTFVSLLGARSRHQFLNLGVPGCALPQQIDILKFRRKDIGNPKLCVFSFFTGNDYFDIAKYYSGGKTRVFYSREPSTSHGLLKMISDLSFRYRFLGRSYLLVYAEQTLINRSMQADRAEPGGAWTMTTPTGKRLANSPLILMDKGGAYRQEAIEALDKALKPLADMSRDEDFDVLFVILPDKHQVDPDLLKMKAGVLGLDPAQLDPELPDSIAAGEFHKFGMRSFDVLNCIKGRKGLYYKIDDHFTPAGHTAVARCLQEDFLPTVDGILGR